MQLVLAEKSMVRSFFLFCLLVAAVSLGGCRTLKSMGCNSADPVEALDWLNKMAAEMEKSPNDNKDAEISQHTYYNRTVFYVQNRCCDRPNELFDCEGNKICEPDGGLTGKGDGRCTDFFEKREGNTLVWPRKQRKFAP